MRLFRKYIKNKRLKSKININRNNNIGTNIRNLIGRIFFEKEGGYENKKALLISVILFFLFNRMYIFPFL